MGLGDTGVKVVNNRYKNGGAWEDQQGANGAAKVTLHDSAGAEIDLSTLATDAKLELVRALLVSLDGKNFATEATLSTLATEAKLEQVRALLATLLTQAQLSSEINVLMGDAAGTIEALRLLLSSLEGKAATEATLAALLTKSTRNPAYAWGRASTAGVGEMQVSVTNEFADAAYYTPTTADFDGSDPGFTAGTRWFRIDSEGFNEAVISFKNDLDVAVTLQLTAFTADNAFGYQRPFLYAEVLQPGGTRNLFPYPGAATQSSSIVVIEALRMPKKNLVLWVTPDADPASGYIEVAFTQR